MKILVVRFRHLTMLLVVGAETRERVSLCQRLAALRHWASQKNRPSLH